MITGLLSAELSATCNALGYFSGSTYYTDPYVKETITDLIRYLRRDDDEHGIRRHLGEARLLQTDLIPIMVHHADKPDLFDVLLRLLVNLTNPALLVYQESVPAERASRHHFIQLIDHLQQYKRAFTTPRIWQVLSDKMAALLQIDYAERDEDQSRTLERILILARNVLQAPADAGDQRPDNDASVHDQVLWVLHQAGMVDLFLYIASTDNEQQFYMHILEIVSLMLREQSPAVLASAALQRSVEEKERDEKELLEIRRREIMERQSKVKKYAGARHSRFGGTFVVKNVKSISDRDLVCHKPLNKAVSLTFDDEKQKIRVPKNKRALNQESSERRSAFSVRLFLKEFCVEFLNGAYNPLMYKVRENLVRATGQPNDETYYFWSMKFFMEFNRLYKFQVKLISETMHQQIFHFVQTQMENWLEHMITDKKKIPIWSRRVHTALKAYQELLMTLQAMDTSGDESVRTSARVIKSNVFYQSEYRELLLFLFNVYADTKFSRLYLKDLVETTHIFVRMLEKFCSKHQNLIVQGKARKKQKKKKKPVSRGGGGGANAANTEAVWSSLAAELSVVLESTDGIPDDVVPFDAAKDLTQQQHKVEAMKKIQAELKNGNFEQAVGLLRASREVWPENNCFGHADMPPDEEFLAMREIFMTDMGQPIDTILPGPENEEEESEEDEEDPRAIEIPEQTFNFTEFLMRFACPRVLSAVCSLLETFPSNSAHTNHCCVKLLHRVAWTCKMPAMLFQASLFRTFQRLYKSSSLEHKELQQFANFIMRKFAEIPKTNRKIFMELLFWKNAREANELEMGYGNVADKQMKGFWREEQEDELRRLAAEYERDTPEPDAVGWIMKNMIDQTRSRRAVAKKLKELFLVVGHMKPTKPKSVKEFNEEQVNELRTLFDQFRDAVDPMNCILGRMAIPRSRKTVVDKLLDMGLITDVKQMRKKKDKSEKTRGADKWGQCSDNESIYDTSDEELDPEIAAKREKRRANVRPPPRTLAQISCHLRRILDAGMRDALQWLRESLQEALEDVTDEPDDEGTALLPLTPLAVQAMDNPSFQQLLDILAIDKPSDQEMYWRIPGRWMAEDFNKKITLITDALEGNLPEISPEDEITQDPGPSSRSSVNDKKQHRKSKKSLVETVRDEGSENASDSANSSDDNDERRSSQNIRRRSSSSSDEGSQRRQNNIVSSLKKQDMESGSDKENENLNYNKVSASSSKKKKLMKRKKITIESDSDDDGGQTSRSKDKKTNKVASDSDTDETNSSCAMSGQKKSKSTSKKRISISSGSNSDSDKNTTVHSTQTLNASLSRNSRRSGSHSSARSKGRNSSSDSDNDKNKKVNSTKTSIGSLSQKSRSRSNSSVRSKSRSGSSDSDNDKNTTINSTRTSIASLSQKSRRSRSNSSRRSKSRSGSSDSDNDKNTTINSTRTSIASLSQKSRRSRSNSSVRSKSRSRSSDSDNDKNATVNSTRTSIASLSQKSRRSRSNSSVRSKSRSRSSDSDNDKNATVNSTKASIASLSQKSRRSRSNSSLRSKSRSGSSDSDNDKNTTINSTRTSIASLSQKSRRSRSNSSRRSKSRSGSSDSDNDKNTTINSTRTSIAPLSQQSRRSRSNSSVRSRRRIDSSDSDSIDNTSTKDINTNTPEIISDKSSHSKRKRFSIKSDSEDVDDPAELSTITVADEKENDRHDKLSNRKKKRLMIDSDSDN